VYKALVEYMAKALVDQPEQVQVEAAENGGTTTIRLQVAPTDLGRVIGKQGRTARAIRTLLHAAASRTKQRVVLEIVE
jgi:predicted RNA-binding protein YlqC (UPF0109 family)